jgi:hypothetical protein
VMCWSHQPVLISMNQPFSYPFVVSMFSFVGQKNTSIISSNIFVDYTCLQSIVYKYFCVYICTHTYIYIHIILTSLDSANPSLVGPLPRSKLSGTEREADPATQQLQQCSTYVRLNITNMF